MSKESDPILPSTSKKKTYGYQYENDEEVPTSGVDNPAYDGDPPDKNNIYPHLDEKPTTKPPNDDKPGIIPRDDEKKVEEANEDESEERQQWSNPVEFLLSCIAMSVGLGNVWRFPFTAYENGGGAFLIPYLIVLMFIGRPLYFLELAIGQFSSSGSVKVWNMVPAMKGVGFGQMIGTSSVVSYYCCLIALSIYYLIASCQSVLPWTVCHPELAQNGSLCVDSGANITHILGEQGGQNLTITGAAEQYFKQGVLKEKLDISNGLGAPDLPLVACLAGCWILLFLTLWKGVASSGKVAYFTAIFPYVVLITLLVRGLTLPGAMTGIKFYITPQWKELLNLKVWYAAVTQSFFSLSTGFGALITYSSYNGFRHNSYRDALIISFADTFTSLLAGFVIFSILGNLAEELGVEVKDVVSSGTGLAFISYPTAIAKFDYVPQLFSVLFFLMLVTLGLGSATGLTSGVIAIVCDLRPDWNKTKVTGVICFLGFGVGLVYTTPGGQSMLTVVDYFGGGFIIFVLAIVEVVAVNWIYGIKRIQYDIKYMLNVTVGIYWKFCWMLFIPISLMGILVYYIATYKPLLYEGREYPPEYIYFGWGLTGLAVIQLPIWMLHSLCTEKGNIFKPNADWGPTNKITKEDWKTQNQFRLTSM